MYQFERQGRRVGTEPAGEINSKRDDGKKTRVMLAAWCIVQLRVLSTPFVPVVCVVERKGFFYIETQQYIHAVVGVGVVGGHERRFQ